MATKDALTQARKEAGLTQEELARKVYVTRQAISRWETGETTPSIDMTKLLASALDVPVMQLLDLPAEPACQCCGTPFSVPNMDRGHDADGHENPDYCKWCYDQGAFAYETMDDVIETSASYLVEATGMDLDEAVSFMGALLPTLDHWKSGDSDSGKAYIVQGVERFGENS
jgi:DNA-binding XRE family transcriptional regulator